MCICIECNYVYNLFLFLHDLVLPHIDTNSTETGTKVQRNTIIAAAAGVTVSLCFLLCIVLYIRYHRKTRRLQMKFDTEYELAANRYIEYL